MIFRMWQQRFKKFLKRFVFTLETRLGICLILIFCLLVGGSMYTLNGINRLATMANDFYQPTFALNTSILHLKASILNVHSSIQQFVFAENPKDREDARQNIKRSEQEINRLLRDLKTQFKTDTSIILPIEASYHQAQSLWNHVITLGDRGQQQAAQDLVFNQETLYVHQLLLNIDQIDVLIHQNALDLLANFQTIRTQTIRSTTLLIAISTGFSLLWLLWMVRLLSLQHRTQASLTFQVTRAEALLKLPLLAEQWEETTFMQRAQEIAEDLTNSCISFIHFINPDTSTIELVTWSRRTLEHYCSAVHDKHYPVAKAGIWADALHQQKAVMFNDYASYAHKKGLPEGHAPLQRLISVPVIEDGKVVMLTGVGNKDTNYTDLDVETVQLISNEIWRIVQRHRTLNYLTQSEHRLREAQHLARLGSWEMDLKSNSLTWSDEVFKIFEIDPKKAPIPLTYEFFLNYVHPEDSYRVKQAYQDSIQNHTVYDVTHRIRIDDGRTKHVHERGETFYDPDGKPLYSVGTIQDITEQFLVAAKLREAAAVFRSTAEGVVITDLNGMILDVNQAFSDITGYSRSDVLGKSPRILKSGKHSRKFYEKLWQELTTKGRWRGEIWNRNKENKVYPELLTISSVEDDHGQARGYVGVFSDISSLKQSQQELFNLAHHNALTQLPNRRLLNNRLEKEIKKSFHQQQSLAVLFIDLDRFKQINDSLGHGMGDLLLQEVARRLNQCVRSSDMVAHLNGDEFVVLLENPKTLENVTEVTQKLMRTVAAPITLDGQEIYITASVGICLFPQDGQEAALLLRNADTAMYHAKAQGRNIYRFYRPEMTDDAFNHILLENALRSALKRQELYLVYQPQLDLQAQTWSGMEALIRWYHPDMGMISPARFIPLAEQTGLIREIGSWVLRSACTQGKVWLDRGYNPGRIAVNVAGPQVQSGDFVEGVKAILEDTQFPPEHLELELTEGLVMQRPEDRIQDLKVLQNLGIQIAIDDFGTGYSSLSYLKQLPIDKLKIDQSFVRDIPQDPNDMAIAEAVIALGNALDLRIIAEGVETEDQAQFLQSKGCHEAQGYLYSKPLPSDGLEKLLFPEPPEP